MAENKIIWNERFNIGLEEIDNAHRRLFSIIDRLVRLNEDEKQRKWSCQEGIKYFKSYAVRHFESEERYMRFIDYDGYEMHKRLHDNMRNKTLPALERELEESDYSPEAVQHFLGICIGWLTGHIMIEDHAITGKTTNKWIHNVDDDARIDLERALIQTMREVLGRKAKLVSSHYSGENFGEVLFSRLTYLTSEGQKFKVYLGYEERLVFHILSEMVGRDVHKLDPTVIYAMSQLSQQLLRRIGAHFNDINISRQPKKENRITYEQLMREFEKGYPPYSMLFDTGVGYFVFCVKP